MPVFTDSKEASVLYVHVPKTGGTYIEALFRANNYDVALWATRPRKFGLVCSPQHFHRALYLPLIQMDLFTLRFMTVRHPVDRLLSQYRNTQKRKPMALLDWLTTVETGLPDNPFMLDNHLRPQHEFHDPALQVFRQEDHFDTPWARLLSADHDLGFRKFEAPVDRFTADTQARLTQAEADRLLAICDRFYAQDYAQFGYRPGDAKALRKVA